VSIFSVLSQHVDYLSQRYAVAAKNVANVDTPGFKAQKIAEFQQTMNSVGGFQLASSQGTSRSANDTGSVTYDISPRKNTEVKNSGNDVNMDQEMSEVGETSRQFAVDMNLEKTFQRMFLASLKG
jgi:flagellar basal-body rod protein FlgB